MLINPVPNKFIPLYLGAILFLLPPVLLFMGDQQLVSYSKSKLQEVAILQFEGKIQTQQPSIKKAYQSNPFLWGTGQPLPIFISELKQVEVAERFSGGNPDVYWNQQGWAVVLQKTFTGEYYIFLSSVHWVDPPFANLGVAVVFFLLLGEVVVFWMLWRWWAQYYHKPLSALSQQRSHFDSIVPYLYKPISTDGLIEGPLRDVIEFQNAIFEQVEDTQGQTERIFNTLYEAIIVFGPDKTIIEANYAAASLLDYGLRSLLGMQIEELVYDPKVDWLQLWWNNYQFSSENPSFETSLKTQRGESVPVRCSVEMLMDAKAQFAGMVFVARDISKQKKQEEKLRTLSKVVEQSPVSIALTDREGIITYVNQAFLAKAMYSENEVLGQHFSGINVSLGNPEVFQDMQAVVDKGSAWRSELKNQNRSGSSHWEQTTVTALRDELGEIQQYMILLEDIHARKLAEQQLQFSKDELEQRVELRVIELKKTTQALEKAYRELQGLDQMKEEFLATVSHELKTPLASILGYAEALFDCEMGREDAKKFYQIIISESVRLTDLINGILELSILKADKHTFEFETVDLGVLVEQAINAVEGLRKTKNVEIAYFSLPIEFRGDSPKMIQVIVNLLSNAVKFTPEGSRVNIKAEIIKGQLFFSVQDSGPGVPKEQLQSVFDRFQQFKRKDQAIQGTGLGLAISQKIIEGHQGKIWAESREDGGYFAFQIPAGIK